MNENCPNAGNFGGLESSEDSIPQESGTNSTPLEVEVDAEASYHHHGDGIGHIPSHTARSIPVRNCTRGQRIVAHNLPPDANYIGSRCTVFLFGKRTALEPLVKLRLAA